MRRVSLPCKVGLHEVITKSPGRGESLPSAMGAGLLLLSGFRLGCLDLTAGDYSMLRVPLFPQRMPCLSHRKLGFDQWVALAGKRRLEESEVRVFIPLALPLCWATGVGCILYQKPQPLAVAPLSACVILFLGSGIHSCLCPLRLWNWDISYTASLGVRYHVFWVP